MEGHVTERSTSYPPCPPMPSCSPHSLPRAAESASPEPQQLPEPCADPHQPPLIGGLAWACHRCCTARRVVPRCGRSTCARPASLTPRTLR
eukprot:874811-Prymnesium_polylepis.1